MVESRRNNRSPATSRGFSVTTVLGAAMKCNQFSGKWPPLKSVKITLNIFAVYLVLSFIEKMD